MTKVRTSISEDAAGFWTEAWRRVLRRRGAVIALAWIALIGFFAVFAPLIANGNPIVLTRLDASGAVVERTYPLFASLSPIDLILLAGTLVGIPLMALSRRVLPIRRSVRLAALAVAAVAFACVTDRWTPPLIDYERCAELEAKHEATAIYTLVPWSPQFGRSAASLMPPGTALGDCVATLRGSVPGARTFVLGTDDFGHDVLSQTMHACRVSISIGFVSTAIAVFIGVTLGALMGYFGGRIDLILSRLVEVFMAIPVLILLVAAAGVLPRNIYVVMAIIGCVTWTGAARFTRAEFLKLRGQDFVVSARAAGLPLRSILFRHMLPNGVTPVLVDASFAIAAAIAFEATIAFLDLGPTDQASWGRLLADTTKDGVFRWWLAVVPGLAIFLTVMSYNVLGEAMRDAIDPMQSHNHRHGNT